MKNFFANLSRKILSFLRVRSTAGGLEVSDQVLRLVYFDGKTWQMTAIRLEPGTLENGKIKNRDAFVTALSGLKAKVLGTKSKKKMNVVTAFSSVNVYSQVFTLPIIEGENLEKAVALNVQMMSPVDAAQVYSGWQLVGRDEAALKLEIAVAFIDKALVDEMTEVLLLAGFITVGIESRPLALMRVLREKGSGIDTGKAYLLVNIDNSGLEFLVVRKGNLYFEYSNRWAEIVNEKGEVPEGKFEETLSASLRQVMNFYGQHWPEPLSAVILSAVAFQEDAEKAIQSSTSGLPIIKLTLVMGQPVSSEWLVALGSSLRGFRSSGQDKEINLLGEGAADTWGREQMLNFLNFWRVVIPVAFGLLVLTFFLANNFLAGTAEDVASQSGSNLGGQSGEVATLQASSTAFNQSIARFAAIEAGLQPKYKVLEALNTIATPLNITLSHVTYGGNGAPVSISGTTSSEDRILALKSAIEADPRFGTVTLPLSAIQQNGTTFSFTMSFPAKWQ